MTHRSKITLAITFIL